MTLLLPSIPQSPMYINEVMTKEWQDFFLEIFNRIGGEYPTLSELTTALIAGLYGVSYDELEKKIEELYGRIFAEPSIPTTDNDSLIIQRIFTDITRDEVVVDGDNIILEGWAKGIMDEPAISPSRIRITDADSPYTIPSINCVIFADTDGGVITANLPPGNDKHIKIVNCGSSGNDVTVDPNGTEQLFGGGAGVAFALMDGEVIEIDYDSTEGWW